MDFEVETFITHALRGEGFDASEDGMGRGTPIVPIAFPERMSGTQYASTEDLSPSLGALNPTAIAIQAGALRTNPNSGPDGVGVQKDIAYTPEARAEAQAVAFDMRGREGGSQFEVPHDTANIRAASGGSSRSYVAEQWAVRRLTPSECEILQGFPAGHTAIPYKRRKIAADEAEQSALGGASVWQESEQWFTDCMADGPRYKMIGNSQAIPNVRWILERVERQFASQKRQAA